MVLTRCPARVRPAGLRAVAAMAGIIVTVASGHAAAGRPGKPSAYTVAAGDTLSGVAVRLRVNMAALAAANGITDLDRIRAGTRLVVPTGPVPAAPAGRGGQGKAVRPSAADLRRLPERLRQAPERLALLPAFDAAAREFGVPADLLKALAWQESGWQNHKVSTARAMGIGQLVPATVDFLNNILLPSRLDPRRPEENIRMSARFLAYLLGQTKGDAAMSVAAYYQGLASVRRSGPIPETRRYVANVLALRAKF